MFRLIITVFKEDAYFSECCSCPLAISMPGRRWNLMVCDNFQGKKKNLCIVGKQLFWGVYFLNYLKVSKDWKVSHRSAFSHSFHPNTTVFKKKDWVVFEGESQDSTVCRLFFFYTLSHETLKVHNNSNYKTNEDVFASPCVVPPYLARLFPDFTDTDHFLMIFLIQTFDLLKSLWVYSVIFNEQKPRAAYKAREGMVHWLWLRHHSNILRSNFRA